MVYANSCTWRILASGGSALEMRLEEFRFNRLLVSSIEVSRFWACDVTSGNVLGLWWVHPKGANSMTASGLGYRKALVGTGWVISLLLCMNQLRKRHSGLMRPPFLTMTLFAQSAQAFVGREPWLLRTCYWGGVVWVTDLQRMSAWAVGKVLSLKTQGNGEFKGPISLKWALENLF